MPTPTGAVTGWAATLDELRELRPGPNAVAVGGHHAVGDGGGGLFCWDPAGTATDDGGTVLAPISGDTPGRWVRLYSGAVNARWFGARGDLSVDDGPAIRTAYTAAIAANAPLHLPGSRFTTGTGGRTAAGYLIRPPEDPPAGQLAGVGLNLADPGVRLVGDGCSLGADPVVDGGVVGHFAGQGTKLVAGAADMTVLQLGNRDQEVTDIVVEGVVEGAGRAAVGVLVKNALFSVLRRVAVYDCAEAAFLFDNHAAGFPSLVGNNDSVRLEYCSANRSATGLLMRPGPDNNALDLLAMDLSNNVSAMVLRGDYLRIWGGTFEGNGPQSGPPAGYAVTVPDDSASHGIRIYSPYFEDNTLGNVYFGAQASFCQYLAAMVSDPHDPLPVLDIAGANSLGTYVVGDPRNNFAEVHHRNTWGRAIRLCPGVATPVSAVSCTGPAADETLSLYGKGDGGLALGYFGSPVQGLWTSDGNPYPPDDAHHQIPATTLAPGETRSVTITVSNNGHGAHPGLGDLALASYSQPLPTGVTLTAAVVVDDLVRVTLVNHANAPATLPTGQLRVGVLVVQGHQPPHPPEATAVRT